MDVGVGCQVISCLTVTEFETNCGRPKNERIGD